jgi:hypothetical protein
MKKIPLAAIALIGLTAPAFAGSLDSAGPARLIQTMHLVDNQRPAAHDLVVPVHARKSRSHGRRYSRGRSYYGSPYRGGFLGFGGGYGGYRGGYGGYRGGYGGYYRGGYGYGGFYGGRH